MSDHEHTVVSFPDSLKGTSSQHRSLGLHIAACESIMKDKSVEGDFEKQLGAEHNLVQGADLRVCQQFIEDSILRCFPITYVLRLLCLYALTWGGIPSRLFAQLKNDFLQVKCNLKKNLF